MSTKWKKKLYNFMEVVDAYLRRATILVLALKWLLLKSRKWFTGIYNSIMLAMCQTENYNSIWVNVSNLSYTLSRHSLTQITLPYEDRNGQHRVHPSIKFLSIRVITHSHGGAICNGQLFDDKRQDDVASNRELTGADCRILFSQTEATEQRHESAGHHFGDGLSAGPTDQRHEWS